MGTFYEGDGFDDPHEERLDCKIPDDGFRYSDGLTEKQKQHYRDLAYRKPVNDLPTGTGEFDVVARPEHYNTQVPPTDKHPNGIECIDVTMHFDTPRGTAIKYIWRAGDKDDMIQDFDKAIAYLEFAKYKELQRRKRA